LAIWGNEIRWNETKHVELEQFWHAFTSRGFDSVSWAFLFKVCRDLAYSLSCYSCLAACHTVWASDNMQTTYLYTVNPVPVHLMNSAVQPLTFLSYSSTSSGLSNTTSTPGVAWSVHPSPAVTARFTSPSAIQFQLRLAILPLVNMLWQCYWGDDNHHLHA